MKAHSRLMLQGYAHCRTLVPRRLDLAIHPEPDVKASVRTSIRSLGSHVDTEQAEGMAEGVKAAVIALLLRYPDR
jgi:hypothetical protein